MALLIATPDSWYLSAAGKKRKLASSTDSPSEVARTLCDAVPAGGPLGILLDASRVFQSCFYKDDIGGKLHPDAIAYRLESELPFSAEDLVHDSIIDETGRIIAFASQRQPINALLKAIEEAAATGQGKAFQLRFITPTSLVVAQRLVTQKTFPDTCTLVLRAGRGQLECLTLNAGVPIQCRVMREDASVAEWRFMLSSSSSSTAPPTYCLAGDSISVPTEHTFTQLSVKQETLISETGNEFVVGRNQPWIDLKRDAGVAGQELGRKRLTQNLCRLAGACLLCIAGCFLYRAYQLNELSQQARREQTTVFQTTFPNQKPPAAILKRLRSEFARVRGSRSSDQDIEAPQQAIPVLAAILDRIPSAVDSSVSEIRIEDGQVYLDMQVRQHEDANRVVEALNGPELEFSPPSTETTDSAVVALLRGRSKGIDE